jgi:hypothetical protein
MRKIAKIAAAIRRALPVLLCDAAGIGGAGLIAYGAWLVYAPAGFIIGGILLLAGAVMTARVVG